MVHTFITATAKLSSIILLIRSFMKAGYNVIASFGNLKSLNWVLETFEAALKVNPNLSVKYNYAHVAPTRGGEYIYFKCSEFVEL